MSDIDIDLSYNIHVKQLIRCCRYFIDLIRQSEFGRIIVISSIWGEIGAKYGNNLLGNEKCTNRFRQSVKSRISDD